MIICKFDRDGLGLLPLWRFRSAQGLRLQALVGLVHHLAFHLELQALLDLGHPPPQGSVVLDSEIQQQQPHLRSDNQQVPQDSALLPHSLLPASVPLLPALVDLRLVLPLHLQLLRSVQLQALPPSASVCPQQRPPRLASGSAQLPRARSGSLHLRALRPSALEHLPHHQLSDSEVLQPRRHLLPSASASLPCLIFL